MKKQMYRKWTEEEIVFLHEKYPSLSVAQLAQGLIRTASSIENKLFKEGLSDRSQMGFRNEVRRDSALKTNGHSLWNPDEDAVLAENYKSRGLSQTTALLPNRTEQAVRARARYLGLTNKRLGTGKQFGFYDSHDWRNNIRPAVLERDGYTCQEPSCNYISFSDRGLRVHHIVPRRLTQNDSLSNLVTLCDTCHHRQPAHWWKTIDDIDYPVLPAYQQEIVGLVTI